MSKIRAIYVLFFAVLLATFAHAAGPTITAISVASVTPTSATITWTTNAAATGQIFYGIGNTSTASPLSRSLVTSHSMTLTGLSQQTVYTYEVQSTDSGGSTTSATNTFALCNPGNPNSGLTTVNAGENASYVTGTVTATWTDNSGVSTSSPTVCGNTFTTTPTATVGLPGNLTMQLPDNNYIIPSPSSWIFTQSNASGLSANEAVTGSTIDLTTAFSLQASSSSGGGGVSSFFGNTGDITALVDPTRIVDAAGSEIQFSVNGSNNTVGMLDSVGDGIVAVSSGEATLSDAAGDEVDMASGVVTVTDSTGDTCTLHSGTLTCTGIALTVASCTGCGGSPSYLAVTSGSGALATTGTSYLNGAGGGTYTLAAGSNGAVVYVIANSERAVTNTVTFTSDNPTVYHQFSCTGPFTVTGFPGVILTMTQQGWAIMSVSSACTVS